MAFADCTSLKNISIPGSIEAIYDGAFSNCTSLTEVTIEGENRTNIDHRYVDVTIILDYNVSRITVLSYTE